MIRLYNTKTLQTEEFRPIEEGKVKMYVCGPTVYNHAHIGNARPMVVFDVLKRLFEAEGYDTTSTGRSGPLYRTTSEQLGAG